VNITAVLKNKGDVAGTYSGKFIIDDKEFLSDEVNILPEMSQKVSITTGF
jgi:hypothetical protein